MKIRSRRLQLWQQPLKGILCFALALLLAVMPCANARAVALYESDGVFYEEGYIFLGESHMGIAATHLLDDTDHSGIIPGLDGVLYNLNWDGTLHGNYIMKGNLFFVFGSLDGQNEETVQTSKNYIYSDGAGKRGVGVIKIHEIINANPNIAHWNIISWHGSVQAKVLEGRTIPNYYVNSYRNWIENEFPQADVYFLSISTMTKYYKGAVNPNLLNEVIRENFPDHYLDYTEFFRQRYPHEMFDPTLRSDTVHWSPKTYTELIVNVVQDIRNRRQNAQTIPEPDPGLVLDPGLMTEPMPDPGLVTEPMPDPGLVTEPVPDPGLVPTPEITVADVDAVLYTNEHTIIFAIPDWNGEVLFAALETGLPIHVTGITDNGFFRVDLGEMTAYIHGIGLSEAGVVPAETP